MLYSGNYKVYVFDIITVEQPVASSNGSQPSVPMPGNVDELHVDVARNTTTAKNAIGPPLNPPVQKMPSEDSSAAITGRDNAEKVVPTESKQKKRRKSNVELAAGTVSNATQPESQTSNPLPTAAKIIPEKAPEDPSLNPSLDPKKISPALSKNKRRQTTGESIETSVVTRERYLHFLCIFSKD